MKEDPGYLRQMASHWRQLAEIGDPMRRRQRERWADALDRLAAAGVAAKDFRESNQSQEEGVS